MKILKRISAIGGVMSTIMFALTLNVYAATPTATGTLDEIMGTIIDTTVALAKTIFTTYWPFVLVFGIIAGLVGVFARFLHIGGKK